MSSLGGGRATNGGASGPVPVPTTGTPTGIRTPRDVMRDRNAREARRQEEQKAEEQRRLAEDRRRSAERRAAAVGGGAPRFSQTSSQYTPESQQAPFDGRGSGGQAVATSDVLGQPTSRISQNYAESRPRGPSVTQQDAPRPAPATAGASRRTQASQQAPRQPTSSHAAAGPSSQQTQNPRPGASSFPHAFERWETLSSHWEGLTSYWLHKLEQNTEEIQNTVPNAVTLNRQITDLSAAGANLFHAVVELQRLRASSERKFQRWFFESRANDEKSREIQTQLEKQLQIERSGRDDATRQRADVSIQAENARREVLEMRRELAISKDEARRAWEELGRRNQESMETAQSLKDGHVTLVHGVQVVPYFGGPSRSASGGPRPSTGGAQPTYSSTGMASAAGAAGLRSPGDDREYYHEEGSPTNTDPFFESGGVQAPPLQSDSGKTSLAAGTYQPYNVGGTPTTSSTAQTAIPLAGQRPGPASAGSLGASRTPQAAGSSGIPVTAQEAQRFYQHAPQQTFLHSPQSTSQAVASGQAAPPAREDVRSEASYVDTISEGEQEYLIDASGNYRLDDQGRRIPYRGLVQSSGTDESYELGANVSGPMEHGVGAQYGGAVLPEVPSVPSTSAQAMASYAPTSSQDARRPSYEGAGYEGWESLQTRHHHPTRLSDVLEEEEERSSRRTGD